MIEGLVSTIIPVYNRDAMLREAVDSVLAQTWRPLEIIIVDDGSTDNTPDVLEELRAQQPGIVRLLHQKNSGPGPARQNGLETSRGEFIQFLDSDDLLLPDKFSLQVKGLRADPEAGISYGKTFAQVNGVRLAQPSQRTGEAHRDIFPTILNGRIWETSTPLYRRSALAHVPPWSAKRQLEDWEYDGAAGVAGIKLHYCDAYVSEYRNHSGPRLCFSWIDDPNAMRDRISAYESMLEYARKTCVPRDHPDMQRFVRSLFWMARNAGSYGLPIEARRLFELARSHATNPGWDYRLFALGARTIGWKRTIALAETARRWKS